MIRRDFLASLLAMGASVTLPVPIALATTEQLDDAWQQLQDCPLLFAVDDDGTIVDPTTHDPEFRRDVFSFDEKDVSSPDAIIDMAQDSSFAPRLQAMAEAWCDLADQRLTRPLSATARRQLEALIGAIKEDPDNGWQEWVTHHGMACHQQIVAAYKNWLDEALDDNDIERLPPMWGQRGEAKQFFEGLGRKALEVMGVRIIDGDCPGSSYFAARLVGSIDAANAGAQSLGFPFRFRPERLDLQNLPEDPAIRCSLATAGVPRSEWPPYPISSDDATRAIAGFEGRRS